MVQSSFHFHFSSSHVFGPSRHVNSFSRLIRYNCDDFLPLLSYILPQLPHRAHRDTHTLTPQGTILARSVVSFVRPPSNLEATRIPTGLSHRTVLPLPGSSSQVEVLLRVPSGGVEAILYAVLHPRAPTVTNTTAATIIITTIDIWTNMNRILSGRSATM